MSQRPFIKTAEGGRIRVNREEEQRWMPQMHPGAHCGPESGEDSDCGALSVALSVPA